MRLNNLICENRNDDRLFADWPEIERSGNEHIVEVCFKLYIVDASYNKVPKILLNSTLLSMYKSRS